MTKNTVVTVFTAVSQRNPVFEPTQRILFLWKTSLFYVFSLASCIFENAALKKITT